MIVGAYGFSQALPFSCLKACGRLPAFVWRRLDREIARAVKSVAAMRGSA